MAQDFLPRGDREFLTWMQNFLNLADEFKTELGLTPTRIDEIANAIANFLNALGTAEAKRAESIAATREKEMTRDEAEQLIRTIVERIKTEPGMTDTIRIGMGLVVPSGERTNRSPVPPQDLVAEIEGDGSVHLDWESGGNTSGVLYAIEVRVGANGEFTLVDVTKRRNYYHRNAPKGMLTYRVVARRNDESSGASNMAIVEM